MWGQSRQGLTHLGQEKELFTRSNVLILIYIYFFFLFPRSSSIVLFCCWLAGQPTKQKRTILVGVVTARLDTFGMRKSFIAFYYILYLFIFFDPPFFLHLLWGTIMSPEQILGGDNRTTKQMQAVGKSRQGLTHLG